MKNGFEIVPCMYDTNTVEFAVKDMVTGRYVAEGCATIAEAERERDQYLEELRGAAHGPWGTPTPPLRSLMGAETVAYSTYEAAAINRFADTYLGAVVGADEDEAFESAKSTYDQLYRRNPNETAAVDALYAEMARYEDM